MSLFGVIQINILHLVLLPCDYIIWQQRTLRNRSNAWLALVWVAILWLCATFFFFVMFWDKNRNWFKPQRTKETWNERQTGRQKWWREEWINVSCCLGWWICDGTSGGLMPACWRLIMGHKVGENEGGAGGGEVGWNSRGELSRRDRS